MQTLRPRVEEILLYAILASDAWETKQERQKAHEVELRTFAIVVKS